MGLRPAPIEERVLAIASFLQILSRARGSKEVSVCSVGCGMVVRGRRGFTDSFCSQRAALVSEGSGVGPGGGGATEGISGPPLKGRWGAGRGSATCFTFISRRGPKLRVCGQKTGFQGETPTRPSVYCPTPGIFSSGVPPEHQRKLACSPKLHES